jgi:hypothetical protein
VPQPTTLPRAPQSALYPRKGHGLQFLLSHIRSKFDHENYRSRDFKRHVFGPLNYEKVIFDMLFVSTYAWLPISLAPERLHRFNSRSAFNNVSLPGRCSVNLNIPAPKIRTLGRGPKTQNGNFFETDYIDFDWISVIYRPYTLKKKRLRRWYLQESNRRRNMDRNASVIFLETDVTAQTDSFVVRYSETKNGLTNNNRFRYQGNAVKINCIWERIRNVFTSIF